MPADRPRRRAKISSVGSPPPAPTRQVGFLTPDDALMLHLVRANMELLREIASRYEVSWLSRSTSSGDARFVHSPTDVASYLRAEMEDLVQEQLRVVLLDTKNRILSVALVYQGSVNSAAISGVGDCFREALRLGAASIILVHNHPSGDPTPSPEDERVTAAVANAGMLLGVELLDHVIIGRPEHASLRERGMYTPPVPSDRPGRE